ncbi:phage replisome organizer N-terminal domain-containing protein [Carnobacterium maltaromaticum]|uniref:phage replisome organizer N-terminal domain-containing protein n=1 Tax=Carnobacterium maltaromaticum TaxID=2751 RepID=UPI0039BDC8AD
MAEISWIKLSTGLPDNRKIKRIRNLPDGDKVILFWVFLLARAGESNKQGGLYFTETLPYTPEDMAIDFDFTLDVVSFSLITLEKFGMIETYDQVIFIKNWEEYQALDGMEKIKEQNRIRKQNQRLRQKELVMSRDSHAEITPCHATDIDKELDIDKENRSKKSSLEQDFDKLWKLYPKKTLKSDGLSAYKKAIAEGITNKDIQDGIINYKQELAANDWQKPMDGGRWFKKRRWEDTFKTENTGIQKYKTLQEAMEEG